MTLHKEYHELENGQQVKFSVSFTKGYGYRITVVPVKITKHEGYFMEEFGAFTGFNDMLLLVERQSSKRLQSAINLISGRKQQYLDHIRVKVGILDRDEYKKRYLIES
jgi:hypothetical protein